MPTRYVSSGNVNQLITNILFLQDHLVNVVPMESYEQLQLLLAQLQGHNQRLAAAMFAHRLQQVILVQCRECLVSEKQNNFRCNIRVFASTTEKSNQLQCKCIQSCKSL